MKHRATARNLNHTITPPAALAGAILLTLAAAVAPAAASVTAPVDRPAAHTPAPLVQALNAADPKPPLVLTTAAPIAAAPAKVNPPAPPRPAQIGWVHPLPNSARGHGGGCYGTYRATPWVHYHKGVDLTAPSGMPIRAVHSGVVVAHAYQAGGAGNYVAVDHGDGYQTVYMHMVRPGLPVGTHVATGDVIGYVGATGDAQGPHLHFEVHRGLWHQIDPAPFMRARGIDVGC